MTLDSFKSLCAQAINGTRHVDEAETLEILRFLSPENRERAAMCYAAIVGERLVPASFGRKHALPVLQKPAKGRAQENRNARARRLLEEMRDERG